MYLASYHTIHMQIMMFVMPTLLMFALICLSYATELICLSWATAANIPLMFWKLLMFVLICLSQATVGDILPFGTVYSSMMGNK